MSTEIVNVPSVNVEPQRVNMQVMLLQSLFEEAVRGDILKLLKCVDLRQFIFDSKFVVGIYVSDEFSEGRLSGEC